MTQVYQYHIRYYKTSRRGRKQFYKLTSPLFSLKLACEEEMWHELRKLGISESYSLDAYWIDSVLVDDLSNVILPF